MKEIVIKLSDELYENVLSDNWCGNPIIRQAIKNGKPLTEVIEDIIKKLINKPCLNQNMMAQNLAYRNVQKAVKEYTHEIN